MTKPGHLGVGGVDQEQVDALVAEPGEPGQVGEPAVERQLVELDVAGVQHQPGRRADGDRERVRDRVVDREELAVPRARAAAASPSATSSRCGVSRCSLHLAATSASVNREPTTGRSGRWRSRNGTAPMWSSWPWVSTSASMSSRRSSMARKSGRIRSTPGESSAGNSTPQSTTSSRPSYSKTVMLRPISPMPPSATTRSPPSGSAGVARRAARRGWPRPAAAARAALVAPGRPGPAVGPGSVGSCRRAAQWALASHGRAMRSAVRDLGAEVGAAARARRCTVGPGWASRSRGSGRAATPAAAGRPRWPRPARRWRVAAGAGCRRRRGRAGAARSCEHRPADPAHRAAAPAAGSR